jgi:hypothetical protein
LPVTLSGEGSAEVWLVAGKMLWRLRLDCVAVFLSDVAQLKNRAILRGLVRETAHSLFAPDPDGFTRRRKEFTRKRETTEKREMLRVSDPADSRQ